MRLEGRNHWFRFLYVHDNGDVTFWGPVTKQGQQKSQGQFITVHPKMVKQ